MEYSGQANHGTAQEGERRAGKIRTRLQSKNAAQQEQQNAYIKKGLSSAEWWDQNVRGQKDIALFYRLYYPQYPEQLAEAIAKRIAGIIEKSKRGEQLTETEKEYVIKSKEPAKVWDYEDEIKQQEIQGKINIAMQRLASLISE